jgi:hypothetical protein
VAKSPSTPPTCDADELAGDEFEGGAAVFAGSAL